MGTNYYWYPNKTCDKCGREDKDIHIGKSSYGWCFSLHVYPNSYDDPAIRTLADWVTLFNAEGSEIKDEYHRVVTPQEMVEIITKRRGLPRSNESQEWYTQNHASPGPHDLARHQLDGQFCVGHGDGTWDLLVGEFS